MKTKMLVNENGVWVEERGKYSAPVCCLNCEWLDRFGIGNGPACIRFVPNLPTKRGRCSWQKPIPEIVQVDYPEGNIWG